jgi:hypothetical protein
VTKRTLQEYMVDLLSWTALRHRHIPYEWHMGPDAYFEFCVSLGIPAVARPHMTFHRLPVVVKPDAWGIGLHPV